MAGGERLAVPFTFKGVSGAHVATLGSSSSNELAPIEDTLSAEKVRTTKHWPYEAPSLSYLSLETAPTVVPGTDPVVYALQFNLSTYANAYNVLEYVDGDQVYYRETSGTSNTPNGLTNYGTYYVGVSQSAQYYYVSFHNTRTDALQKTNSIVLTNGTLTSSPKSFIVKVSELITVRNALFDYNNDYPRFSVWPQGIMPDSDHTTPSWNELLTNWNHWGGTLLEGQEYRRWAGQTFLQNDFPYRDSGSGTPAQARAISMFGAGTINPAGLSTGGNAQKIGHTTDDIKNSVTTWAGTDSQKIWVSHDWTQPFEIPKLEVGGKIRFGAKVRVDADDMIREKNFGSIYLSLVYPTSSSSVKNLISYITIKRRNTTLNLPQGALTHPYRIYNFSIPGMQFQAGQGSGNDSEEIGAGSLADARVVSEVASYAAEDLGSWKEVMFELDVPTDIDYDEISRTIYSTGYSSPAGTVQSTNYRMGIGLRFSENGEYISDDAEGYTVASNALVQGQTYQIASNNLGGSATLPTQAELHEIAGTEPSGVESSDTMKIGGTYTIVSLGSENWNGINVEVGGGQAQSMTSYLNDASVSLADIPVGLTFKVAGITTGLNGTGTVTRKGYPQFGFITVRNVPAYTKGLFKRTSGAVQFYSPYVEYIPPST
jgi:hypothetical protein